MLTLLEKRNLAQAMVRSQAVRYGDFTLKSGAKSDIYVDCRRLLTTSDNAGLAGKFLSKLVCDSLDNRPVGQPYIPASSVFLAAVPDGALPLLSATLIEGIRGGWLHHDVCAGWVRSSKKDHGLADLLVGAFVEPEEMAKRHVIMIEDVVTSGGSVWEAINTLQSRGISVKGVVSLLDRSEGNLPFSPLPYSAALTMAELREFTKPETT